MVRNRKSIFEMALSCNLTLIPTAFLFCFKYDNVFIVPFRSVDYGKQHCGVSQAVQKNMGNWSKLENYLTVGVVCSRPWGVI